jgi:hypothetical protein
MVRYDLNDVFTAELAESAEKNHISCLADFASACSAISSAAGGKLVSNNNELNNNFRKTILASTSTEVFLWRHLEDERHG